MHPYQHVSPNASVFIKMGMGPWGRLSVSKKTTGVKKKGTKAKVVRDKTSLQNNQKPSFFQQLLTSAKSAKCCLYCVVPSSFFVILIYFEKMMKCLLCCHHVVCIFRFTHLWKRSVSRECCCFFQDPRSLDTGWSLSNMGEVVMGRRWVA